MRLDKHAKEYALCAGPTGKITLQLPSLVPEQSAIGKSSVALCHKANCYLLSNAVVLTTRAGKQAAGTGKTFAKEHQTSPATMFNAVREAMGDQKPAAKATAPKPVNGITNPDRMHLPR